MSFNAIRCIGRDGEHGEWDDVACRQPPCRRRRPFRVECVSSPALQEAGLFLDDGA
jgi:hypothetical protein